MDFKKILCLFFVIVTMSAVFAGCKAESIPADDVPVTDVVVDDGPKTDYVLNGVDLEEYEIVYAFGDSDYTERAAEYVKEKIAKKTGVELSVKSDKEKPKQSKHEIVIGNTKRAVSSKLDEKTEGFSFAIMASSGHVAIEGKQFVIAAAAYYFVETYIKSEPFESTVSETAGIYEPIVESPNNFVIMIGDGMGFNQTLLFDSLLLKTVNPFDDGEDEFYGYMFPYSGSSRTDSLSGTTDSAAGGTALATGYKTKNGYIGKDANLKNVKNLTELAYELGKATAVMSTEVATGATPASFSAHAVSRDDTSDISACQKALSEENGTLVLGGYGSDYAKTSIEKVENALTEALTALSEDEDGFFMMYEEAYIDKHCHSNDMENAFYAVSRFNQAIGLVMEYAFYNPDTLVLITADHETGGLTTLTGTMFYYTSENHTSADVPVFAYGEGAEIFATEMENIQIPKTFAALMGAELKGYDDKAYPSLAGK